MPSLGLTAVFVVPLWVGACAGPRHLATRTEAVATPERTAGTAAAATDESRTDALQFDNQATVGVDVYLVGQQIQWRLGRVPPGMRVKLRVPESAIQWTVGFLQLAVIPGSALSAQASRDPRAVLSIAQPPREVLSQRWTFRQPGGAALQLQATRLTRGW